MPFSVIGLTFPLPQTVPLIRTTRNSATISLRLGPKCARLWARNSNRTYLWSCPRSWRLRARKLMFQFMVHHFELVSFAHLLICHLQIRRGRGGEHGGARGMGKNLYGRADPWHTNVGHRGKMPSFRDFGNILLDSWRSLRAIPASKS